VIKEKVVSDQGESLASNKEKSVEQTNSKEE